ncbi:MAG: 30S ribosomal protein S6--L-glutamate ligase [Candidatus Saccharibacteria bacterium]|jgi:ribosomal protein S6--L-glutamate ligase
MKIVILSAGRKNYSTQRLVEAAKQRGHAPVVVDYTKAYMAIESRNPSVHWEGRSVDDVQAVIPRIAARYTLYGAAVLRQFEMMRAYTATSSLALVRSRDKLRSMQLLARAGVGIPKTVFASQTAEAAETLELVGGAPVIVKLLESTQGKGVVLAETKKAAKSVIEAFNSINASVILQEFIEEADGADIRVIVVGDKIVGAMMRKGQEGEFRSNLHRGGESVPVELSKKEQNMALKAASTLGLSIAGVDLIRSKRGPLVLEVNSSPGLEGIEKQTKEDIAGKMIDFVVERAQGKRRRDKIGA